MIQRVTDVVTMILAIALIVALVRNASGTSSVIKSSTGGFTDIIKAATFQR